MNDTAHRPGVGIDAYFGSVYSLVFINNRSDIIIADTPNECYRKYNLISQQVTDFAGMSAYGMKWLALTFS